MNIQLVLNTVGKLFLIIAVCMCLPTGMAIYKNSIDLVPFAISLSITILLGIGLKFSFKENNQQFSVREAFAIASFSWLGMSLVGCLPTLITDYYYHKIFFYTNGQATFFASFANSYFEAMSGFTGTGATVINDVEAMPRPLLFWRCFHNSIGGLGILVLFVAILPSLGAAGSKLFRSESSIGSSESAFLYPKIENLAKSLWAVYIGMIFILTILLMLAGMDLFDASCHAFSAMGTGGLSTRNTSIAYYNSATIEGILIVFMFLSSLNCLLLRTVLNGNFRSFYKNSEAQFYIWLLILATTSIAIVNYLFSGNSILEEFRNALFTVVSISSTTGLTTSNYDEWHHYSKTVVIILMIIGGCAGSTSGGLKAIRVVIIAKFILREFKKLLKPHGIFPITLQEKSVESKVIDSTVAYGLLYFITIICISGFVSLFENDITVCFSGVLTCISNVGPGFGKIGPSSNFNDVTSFSKIIFALTMALGRLEMMAFFMLLNPKTWKK